MYITFSMTVSRKEYARNNDAGEVEVKIVIPDSLLANVSLGEEVLKAFTPAILIDAAMTSLKQKEEGNQSEED